MPAKPKTIKDDTLVALPSLQSSPCSDPDDQTTIVDEIYNIVFRAFCGIYPNSEQDKVHQFFDREIYFNWKPGKLVLLFMAYPIHDRVKIDFGNALDYELDQLATRIPSLRPFREKICQMGHSYVRKLNKQRKLLFLRSPDGQTQYNNNDTLQPPFIFDVRWSHSDLREATDEYFEQFLGQVSIYLGFEIDY
ncbi:hypothetical protein F4801DRAFT_381379 [Xylaria longipes]|nr:hypothetical protein F4801DRAFT_381379 [Xylaria longipes]